MTEPIESRVYVIYRTIQQLIGPRSTAEQFYTGDKARPWKFDSALVITNRSEAEKIRTEVSGSIRECKLVW